MANLAELRARIANGEIKTQTGGGTPRVGEGTFTCLGTEAIYGKGENGNPRGMLGLRVLYGGTDAEVGGEFRYYLQTMNDTFAEKEIALWTGILVSMGVAEEKIFDDAETMAEVIANIMVITAKLITRGKVKFIVKRKLQTKQAPDGKLRYYNDLVSATYETPTVPGTIPAAPLTEAPKMLSVGPASAEQIAAIAELAGLPTPPVAAKPWK